MTTNARGGDVTLREGASARGILSEYLRRFAAALGIVLATRMLAGCAAVPVNEQRLVSKPNMQFSRSSIYFYDARLLLQVQPGRFSNGGAQASTCTLCR